MTTVGSASNNPPVSKPPSSNPKGHFSTKALDRAQRKDAAALFKKMSRFHFEPNNADTQKALLNDIYTALESGVVIPQSPQELCLIGYEQTMDELATVRDQVNAPDVTNSLNAGITEVKDILKKHQDISGHYDINGLSADFNETNDPTDQTGQDTMNHLKTAAQTVFMENPQLLFEKIAAYPETVRRLVKVLDLPAQNDKGWNLTSQAAKAGNPKLAKAFEKAGFGSNLYPKAVVDFAKAMSDDAPNAQKSKALKELMGITPLS